MSRRSRRVPSGGVLIALLLAIAGLMPASAAQASTLPVVSIAITPASATIGGALESGGVNIVSTDTGVKEAGVIVFLLKPGVSTAEAEAFVNAKKVKGDPNNTGKIGSIVFDTEANPGQPNEVQTDLQAGQYLLLIGAGEGEPKIRAAFTVAAAKAPAALPTPQAKIRSIEFGFRGPSTLHDGELVGFENEGFLVHMDLVAPVKSIKTARKAIKDLLTGNQKALGKLIVGPPVTFAGPVSNGAYQQETITAKPGIYVEVCFMETQDGRDHSLLGMERIIRITK
jgi:hypothetical protein